MLDQPKTTAASIEVKNYSKNAAKRSFRFGFVATNCWILFSFWSQQRLLICFSHIFYITDTDTITNRFRLNGASNSITDKSNSRDWGDFDWLQFSGQSATGKLFVKTLVTDQRFILTINTQPVRSGTTIHFQPKDNKIYLIQQRYADTSR